MGEGRTAAAADELLIESGKRATISLAALDAPAAMVAASSGVIAVV